MTGATETTIPPFARSERTIVIIKQAAKALQPLLSYRAQSKELEDYSAANAARLGLRRFRMSAQKWNEFVTKGPEYTTKEPDLLETAWHWLFEKHRPQIEALHLTTPTGVAVARNAIVAALAEFYTPGKPVNADRLAQLKGRYAVYRPSFVDPEEIMIMPMECGLGDDPSGFTMTAKYWSDEGDELEEQIDGYAVPYGECILFIGRLVKARSPFIFILSGLAHDPASGGFSRGDGTLLVGARGSMSSAFPIAVRRTEREVIPRTLSKVAFQEEVKGHRSIEAEMRRGIVPWRGQ